MRLPSAYILLVLSVLPMQGCFTGVENTPKITYSDVKKENIVVTAEETYLDDIVPLPPSEWQPGKRFQVTDNKISFIFTPASTASRDSLASEVIEFSELRKASSVVGEDVAEIVFIAPSGGTLIYRTDIPYDDILKRSSLDIPFAIDCDIVDAVRNELYGKRYYVVTPLWYEAASDSPVQGLRHVAVDIEDVLPGNSVYPIRVVFRKANDASDSALYSMFMTLGYRRTSTRNFEKLFTFENPRKRYPRITDDVWNLIMHSRVREGMTRDECRLALGAPKTIGQRPTTAGMVEYWQYPEGIYLLFEEDYLTYYRR